MPHLSRVRSNDRLAALGTSLFAGVLLVSAVLARPTTTAARGAEPVSASMGLTRFASCAQLHSWQVATTGYGAPLGRDDRFAQPLPPLADMSAAEGAERHTPTEDPDTAVGSSPTGTNTQEAGVDEPDVAKTDGTVLVHVVGGSVEISEVTGDQPQPRASYRLPAGMTDAELLLAGTRVVVTGTTGYQRLGNQPMDDVRHVPIRPIPLPASARVLTLDISDPARPRRVGDETFSGTLVSARQYGDTVRLITSSGQSVDDWLPTVRGSGQPRSAARPLVDCSHVLHPRKVAGPGIVSVVGFDVAEPTSVSSVAVAAGGDTVYSSTGAIYVATTDDLARTEIHQFDLTGHRASYVASGRVPGVVRDRWSMDEYDGHLRLALQTGSPEAVEDGAWRKGSNAIVTLARQGHRLVETGRVGGLGDGEAIQSVRWFDDLAVLVTFRQMDPLFTVDVTDPDRPRSMGELRMPGFSGYLHPLGHHRLLGLGTDASSSGLARGALVSVFDLSDLRHPVRTGSRTFDGPTRLSAVDDPRGFTWLPAAGTGFTQLQDWSGGGEFRLARISVDPHGGLTTTVEQIPGVPTADTARVLPLPGGRILLVVGGTVRTLTP